MRSLRMAWRFAATLAMVVACSAVTAQADVITLQDLNAVAKVDTSSQRGMFHWSIGGSNILAQQWFWYRIGSTDPERSIDTLQLRGVTVSDITGDSVDDTLNLNYRENANRFELSVSYSLFGSDPGWDYSDIQESIRIKNTGTAALDFHFFQYSDFDLTPQDQVAFLNENTVRHWGPGAGISETAVIQMPNAHQAGVSPSIRDSLNDGLPTTLSNVDAAGPGDASWAFQWDFTIGRGQTIIISKDKLFHAPEPGGVALLGTAGLLCVLLQRKRRAASK